MGKRLTYEYVKEYFKKQGCDLMEEEYKNCKIKMKYRCSCGNISETTFIHFRRGHRCQKCGGCEKYTLKYIEQFFKDHDCKLLENKYKNNRHPMKYRCKCGIISKISFDNFLRGRRCKKCGIEKRSGENSNIWNFELTDEERIKNKARHTDLVYRKWRTGAYKRDDYTCQKCYQRGRILNAHHIEGYAENPNLRTDEDNGITFCIDCHKEFHHIYGYKNNNRQQLEEFLTEDKLVFSHI